MVISAAISIGAYSVLDGGSNQFSAGSTLPFDGGLQSAVVLDINL